MKISAIVPLRSLHDGKRRLSGVVSPVERASLVRQLFERTCAALHGSGCVASVAVVSPDPAVLDWATTRDVRPIWQPDTGLNAGLELARDTALGDPQIEAVLVILPDLPFVDALDIRALARLAERGTVVLAPDRHGAGTNALVVARHDPLRFAFGAGSLARHLATARRCGLDVRRYEARGTAFDVDSPDDLELVSQEARDEALRTT